MVYCENKPWEVFCLMSRGDNWNLIEEGSSWIKFYEDHGLTTTLHKDLVAEILKVFVIFTYVLCFYKSAKNDEFCKSPNVYLIHTMCTCVSILAILQMKILKKKKKQIHVPCFSKKSTTLPFFWLNCSYQEHIHY